jgi:hypothetical protein
LDLQTLWTSWKLDLSRNEMHEVVGGLLARQVSLATEMARSPEIWNPHIGPLVLRSMVDLHITISWILLEPEKRAQQYIAYGLGQVKLLIEHLKATALEGQLDTQTEETVAALEEWHNSQRLTFLTEVNVGSWSGLSTRKMAEEAGCLDLYTYAYTPLSEAAHSMWHHISLFNLQRCANPLHRLHSIPHSPRLMPQIYFLHMGANYLEQTFILIYESLGLKPYPASAFDLLMARLESLGSQVENEDDSIVVETNGGDGQSNTEIADVKE